MRRLENYVRKYGEERGPVLLHAMQSQAAHAGVSARLRRKIDALTKKAEQPAPQTNEVTMPLFPETDGVGRTPEVGVSVAETA